MTEKPSTSTASSSIPSSAPFPGKAPLKPGKLGVPLKSTMKSSPRVTTEFEMSKRLNLIYKNGTKIKFEALDFDNIADDEFQSFFKCNGIFCPPNADRRIMIALCFDTFESRMAENELKLKPMCLKCFATPWCIMACGHQGLCKKCLKNGPVGEHGCLQCLLQEDEIEMAIVQAYENNLLIVEWEGGNFLLTEQRFVVPSVEVGQILIDGSFHQLTQEQVLELFRLNNLHAGMKIEYKKHLHPVLKLSFRSRTQIRCSSSRHDELQEPAGVRVKPRECNHVDLCYDCLEANGLRCPKCNCNLKDGSSRIEHSIIPE